MASTPADKDKASAAASLSRQKSTAVLLAPASALSKTASKVSIASTVDQKSSDLPALPKLDSAPPVGEALAPGNINVELPADGIIPLFLASMTQEIFKMKSGEDVTADKPIKIIPKADIVADVMARRAVSDFQPVLAKIQLKKEYPGDELMVYFDSEFKYGQNFFLVIVPAVVDLILRPPTAEAVPEEAMATYVKGKKPVSKPWECLGSDKDIEMEQVFNTRDFVQVKISRQVKELGKECTFSNIDGTETGFECKSFKDASYEVNRMELNLGIQSIPELETKACQTNWFRPQNFSVQYEPLEISEEERRRLLDTDEVIDFVKFVADRKVLQQNSIVNVFSDDFKELGDDDVGFEKGSHSVLQEYQSFTDLQHSKDKSVSCCDWHPTQKGIIAVSCTKRCTFEERIEQGFVVRSKQSLILIWSFNDPIHPQLILEGPEDIGCFQFNPSDPNFIAGGCINGQIVLWDISEHQDKLKSTRKRSSEDENGGNTGSSAGVDDEKLSSTIGGNDEPIVPVVKYIVASSIEFSHRSGISDLQWLPSSSLLSHSGELTENTDSGNRQLVTCSLDGQVYFWDTRSKKDLRALDLAWKPFLRVPLSAMDNTFDYGLTKVSLKSMNFIDARKEKPKSGDKSEEKRDAKKDAASVVPISKFFASSEEGEILFSDWVAEKSSEDKGSRVEYASNLHFGSISDLQRSPFFPDILLSVGGWSFHIWKEKLFGGPLLSSPTNNSYVISGRWSPTRPGVVFLSKSDGTIEVWDILDCTFQPNTVQNVASVGLSNMCVRQYPGKGGAQFVAAADDEGTLHILEVPRHLTKPLKNEKLLMQALFDREVKRIGYVLERKQIRNREKGAWEQSKQEAVLAAKAQAAALEAAAAEAAKKVDPDKAAPAAESAGENGEAPPEEVVDKEELEYLKFEKNFLISEGLLKEDSE